MCRRVLLLRRKRTDNSDIVEEEIIGFGDAFDLAKEPTDVILAKKVLQFFLRSYLEPTCRVL